MNIDRHPASSGDFALKQGTPLVISGTSALSSCAGTATRTHASPVASGHVPGGGDAEVEHRSHEYAPWGHVPGVPTPSDLIPMPAYVVQQSPIHVRALSAHNRGRRGRASTCCQCSRWPGLNQCIDVGCAGTRGISRGINPRRTDRPTRTTRSQVLVGHRLRGGIACGLALRRCAILTLPMLQCRIASPCDPDADATP